MSAAKSSTLSATPAARCTRVPAAGMKPDDSAVDPAGTASRSITTHSTPDRASRMAAVTAGAAADDEHGQRQFRRGLRVRSVHRTIPAMKSSQARRSATLRRSASAASCNAGVGAAQPSASTVTW